MTTPGPSADPGARAAVAPAFDVARALQRQGRLHAAERLFRSILAVEPRHFASLFRLGAIRARQGRTGEAVAMFHQAAGAAAESAQAQVSVGIMLVRLNRPADAIACYRRALAVDPEHADAHNNLGNALDAIGRSEEATEHYASALAIRPDFAEAHSNLGHALHRLGRPAEALAHYDRALKIKPDHAEAHNNYGSSLHALGRLEEAVSRYERALAINPKLIRTRCNLGIVLAALDRLEDAIAQFRQALAVSPADPDTHRNLGDVLLRLDRHEDAIAHYRKALARRPDDAEIHNNLAHVLQKVGRFEDAVVHGRRAVAIKPDDPDARGNLGNALMALHCDEEALDQYERALAIKPDHVEAQNNIGVALQALGRLDEAGRAYERAAGLAPGRAAIHLNLAHSKPFTPGDPRLATLEALARDPARLDPEEQIALHFALGKAFADLEQPERSFQHLVAGNAFKRRQVEYDEPDTLRLLERIRQVFTADLLRQHGGGDSSRVPVFVVGMPRSGTTLVEQILATHSKIFGAGEREDFSLAVSSLRGPDGAAFPEAVAAMSPDALRRFGSDYLDAIRKAAPAAERIIDKMPSNFLYVGLIHLALPNARIIHLRRDGVDTCLSCFSLLFAGNQPYAYDLGELGRYYRAYEALMAHWRAVLPDGVMIDVEYEKLVDDLEGETRRMLAHCRLDWEDACLAFYDTKRPVQTASAMQVRRPIYRSSVGRWRRYSHLLEPLLEALGVEPEKAAPAAGSKADLGVALAGLGRHAEAVVCYQEALAVDPEDAGTHNNLGNALHALGRTGEAVARYEKAVAIRPDHAEALSNLGNALHVLGRPGEAVAQLERALALKPDFAGARNNFGNALHALGQSEQAVAQLERAVAIEPGFAEAHCNLGIVLCALGRHDQAIARFERALAVDPRHADAHRNLADVLCRLGRDGEAIAHYQKALAVRPDYAEACNNLGNLLRRLERTDEALAQYERALAIKPSYADAQCNLGDLLLALDRHEEAIARYERTLAIEPSRAAAWNHLGIALQAAGRVEEARRAHERAVEFSPLNPGFHLNLAHAKPFTAGDPRLDALETLARDVSALGEDDRIVLHFAFAKAFADLEQHERSFRHLLEGNALKRRQVAYDEAETLKTFARVCAVVTGALMREKRGGGDPSAAPVFVVGMPRSGTTLIEQILASHSKVFGAGEVDDLGRTVSDFARSRHATDGILDLLPTLTAEDLRRIGGSYVGRIRAAAPAAERIVNKMPANYLFIGLIHLALPNARIIHACRDPMDTCLSCFSLLFAGEQSYAYELGELGRYYRAYQVLMRHWRDVLPDGVMIDVRYEDVVADLEGSARKILAHCGLPWEDACLKFHATRRSVRTASAGQVRRPIYQSSVGRWRPYREWLTPLIEALDVAPDDGGHGPVG